MKFQASNSRNIANEENKLPSSLSFRTQTAFCNGKNRWRKRPRKPMTTILPAFRQTNLRSRSGSAGKKRGRDRGRVAVAGKSITMKDGGREPNGNVGRYMWDFQNFAVQMILHYCMKWFSSLKLPFTKQKRQKMMEFSAWKMYSAAPPVLFHWSSTRSTACFRRVQDALILGLERKVPVSQQI